MAERVGFEPTVELPRQQFSRLPDSAALAPLRSSLCLKRWQDGVKQRLQYVDVWRAYRGEGEFSNGLFPPEKKVLDVGEVLSIVQRANKDSLDPLISFPSISRLVVDQPPRITFENDCIDLWSFSLDAGMDALERFHLWLSEDERVRGARFIHGEDQRRYTLAHGGLRAVLARYVGLPAGALRFRTNATGKPGLINQQGDSLPVEFNLSHSHGRMLIAMGEGRDVGIDLEQIRDNVEVAKLAERFYAPTEFKRIMRCAAPDQQREFYRYWVAKEAVLKGQGIGLPSLQQCEIPSDLVSPSAVHVPPDSRLQSGWTIQWLNCGIGWQGAVSAYGSDWRVRIMNAAS